MQSPKLIHYTEGGPWHGHVNQEFVQEWFDEFSHMTTGSNPHAHYVESWQSTYVEATISFGDE